MVDGLPLKSALQNTEEHGGSFFLSGISSYMNLRNDVLSYPINKFVVEASRNPLLPVFEGTFHEISSPVSRGDPVNHEPVIGISVANLFMKRVVNAAVEAPIVRVKLLLQNQGELINSGRLSTPYKGITDCFARTIKNEGILSLWRGNSAALLRILPDQTLNIVSNATFKRFAFKFRGEKDGNKNWFLGNLIADVAAGASSCLCSYPLEFAHTRLANDIKSVGGRQFKGLVDVYKKTLISDGIVGIYRGVGVACLGTVAFNCLTTPVRRRVKSNHSKQKISLERVVLDSSIVVVTPLACYPFYTISRRMMMTSGEGFKYKSSIHAFRHIIQNEGIKSLYKGFGASMLRFAPAFCVYATWGKWVKHTQSGACISVVVETK